MGVAGNQTYMVDCLPTNTPGEDDQLFRFQIDGKEHAVKLKISNLSQQLVCNLPDRSLDLLEIAALVYGVDSTISRGGLTDQQMAKKWHRQFQIDMPVRDMALWEQASIRQELEEMLMFLSGDRFVFNFVQKQDTLGQPSRFFDFDDESGWQPDRVLMFSGGLDSFAGAIEEIAEQGHKVALVSHFSSTKIAPVQRKLRKALASQFGDKTCCHVPVQVQMMKGSLKEGTHRARSFLFAVLGSITAQVFNQNRVSFHENGIVSLNLPPVGNVLGTRATRTTHPQTLTRFTNLLSLVFKGGMRIDNPYFWRTKTQVVETISRLGMADEIAQTRSCADVHNQVIQHPHCGRCSQCIDRRFAILAANLAQHDPQEAYRVDLLEGERNSVINREIALSYVRNADAYEHMTPQKLTQHFPAVMHAVGHLDQPDETALAMIVDLLRRHSSAVEKVMRSAFDKQPAMDYPEGSLPRLYGDAQGKVLLPTITNLTEPTPEPSIIEAVVNEKQKAITFNDAVVFRKNATAELLIVLASKWLEGAGAGLDPLDYPMLRAKELANLQGLASEESLRKRINRSRKEINKRFQSAGLDGTQANTIIENNPWHGYRLNPTLLQVRRVEKN